MDTENDKNENNTTNATANDVQALLEQLRTSQAWQDVMSKRTADPPPPLHASSSTPVSKTDVSTSEERTQSNSVADLLSQLKEGGWSSTSTPTSSNPSLDPRQRNNSQHHAYTPTIQLPHIRERPQTSEPSNVNVTTRTTRTTAPRDPSDTRNPTFQEALGYLADVSTDSVFVSRVTRLKREQEDLESKLSQERKGIVRKYEERVKVAQTKAKIISAGLGQTKHEAMMLTDALNRELRKFDLERALPAWDGLVSQQQSALESLGVPTMFVSEAKSDRETQQRVMRVLEGVINDSNSASL